MKLVLNFAALALFQATCLALRHVPHYDPVKAHADSPYAGKGGKVARQATAIPATFEQYIDHNNKSIGTFTQRYWYNVDFWKGPGSPVVLNNNGEARADGNAEYFFDPKLESTGLIAQELGAAQILIEHRYYGDSTPFLIQDTKALQYHTLDNAIADMVHFARTVELPFDLNGTTNAPQAPWVLYGGSYAGALAAWTAALAPGTFWAYHSSSGVVEAIYSFWSYYIAAEQGLPRNCTSDLHTIIDHVDKVLASGDRTAITDLKKQFGLEALVHDDDFATALESPLENWQSSPSLVYNLCDVLEGARDPLTEQLLNVTSFPGQQGAGLEIALPRFTAWYQSINLPFFCSAYYAYTETGPWACFESYNTSSPRYTDWSADNVFYRPWTWTLCNEPFAWWVDGAPPNMPSLVSRFYTTKYSQQQCALAFPPVDGYTYGSARGKTVSTENRHTGGWNLKTERLVFVNSEFDPWRAATVASTIRPGGPLASTEEVPTFIVKGGHHCSDFPIRNITEVAVVQNAARALIKGWVAEFYQGK